MFFYLLYVVKDLDSLSSVACLTWFINPNVLTRLIFQKFQVLLVLLKIGLQRYQISLRQVVYYIKSPTLVVFFHVYVKIRLLSNFSDSLYMVVYLMIP